MDTKNIEEIINTNFFDVIKKEHVTLKELMKEIVENENLIGETNYGVDVKEDEFEEDLSEKKRENYFFQYFATMNDKGKFYLPYYEQSFRISDSVNWMYLDCVEEVYRNWIYEEFGRRKQKNFSGDYKDEINENQILTELKRKTEECFRKKVKQFLGIDLNLIVEIAGLYYESKSSEAVLCFLLVEENEEIKYEMVLNEDIILVPSAVNLHRKMLQMVQSGQCLLYKRDSGLWKIRGIIKEEEALDKGILIRMKGHMSWEMELSKKKIVCYKCGNFKVECDQMKIEEFEKKYEKVFGGKPNAQVVEIVKKALKLKHGSAMIFIDIDDEKYGADTSKYSIATGFVMAQQSLSATGSVMRPELLENVAAIDGTVLFNKHGKCLKFGMILNSDEQGVGKKHRGSRYNSVKNYIKAEKIQDMNAIGVVVSEDEIVNIICCKEEKNVREII